jgi:F-box-like
MSEMFSNDGVLSINLFDRLPDELIEMIFLVSSDKPMSTPYNHVRLPSNEIYFDYSIHQPLLQRNHQQLLLISQVCRRFYNIIKSSHFWEKKSRREHVLLAEDRFPEDFIGYDRLYLNNPFHRSFNFLDTFNWTRQGNDCTINSIVFHLVG